MKLRCFLPYQEIRYRFLCFSLSVAVASLKKMFNHTSTSSSQRAEVMLCGHGHAWFELGLALFATRAPHFCGWRVAPELLRRVPVCTAMIYAKAALKPKLCFLQMCSPGLCVGSVDRPNLSAEISTSIHVGLAAAEQRCLCCLRNHSSCEDSCCWSSNECNPIVPHSAKVPGCLVDRNSHTHGMGNRFRMLFEPLPSCSDSLRRLEKASSHSSLKRVFIPFQSVKARLEKARSVLPFSCKVGNIVHSVQDLG